MGGEKDELKVAYVVAHRYMQFKREEYDFLSSMLRAWTQSRVIVVKSKRKQSDRDDELFEKLIDQTDYACDQYLIARDQVDEIRTQMRES